MKRDAGKSKAAQAGDFIPTLYGNEYPYAIGYIETFLIDLVDRKFSAADMRGRIGQLPADLAASLEKRRAEGDSR